MWRLDHKVLHPPGPGRPRLVLLCCPYLEAILEKPASEVLSRLVWQVRPHLRFSQRSTAQTCARLRTGRAGERLAAGREGLASVCGTPCRIFRGQQDGFPMFHEVLRGSFPARALPLVAAVLFQRKERKDAGFPRCRVRRSEMALSPHGRGAAAAAPAESLARTAAPLKSLDNNELSILIVAFTEIPGFY